MADRPWIAPSDVKGYTEFEKVKNRPDAKLLVDISRAESYIIKRTNNTFADATTYPTIPENIKLAAILVAEHYANIATTDPQKKMQSETFKDYSYTVSEAGADQGVDDLDIDALISDYINKSSAGTLDFRMRRL